jgi:hypothetical protein
MQILVVGYDIVEPMKTISVNNNQIHQADGMMC